VALVGGPGQAGHSSVKMFPKRDHGGARITGGRAWILITVVAGRTSRVTILPAPTVKSSPMLMPGRRIAFAPNQTFSPMTIGLL
jgi:hypothetical protein